MPPLAALWRAALIPDQEELGHTPVRCLFFSGIHALYEVPAARAPSGWGFAPELNLWRASEFLPGVIKKKTTADVQPMHCIERTSVLL